MQKCKKNNKFPDEMMLHIFHRLCMAQIFLHGACGISHGDISSGNIMLRWPGKEFKHLPDGVLMDFSRSTSVNFVLAQKDQMYLYDLFMKTVIPLWQGDTLAGSPSEIHGILRKQMEVRADLHDWVEEGFVAEALTRCHKFEIEKLQAVNCLIDDATHHACNGKPFDEMLKEQIPRLLGV
jgi:serine/threonine protein kinase